MRKQLLLLPLIPLAFQAQAESNVEDRIEQLQKELSQLKESVAESQTPSLGIFDRVKLNGYVNMVLSESDQDIPYWSGEDSELSITDHSSAGVRLTTELSDNTNSVLQFSILPDSAGGYDTGVEWFYIQHYFHPEVSVKAGRLSLPILNYSEEFEVGFAHPWIRPPEEVYGPLPLGEIDGINLAYTPTAGPVEMQFKFTWGRNDFNFDGFEVVQEEIWGIDGELVIADLTLRAAHMRMKIKADLTLDGAAVYSTGVPITPGTPANPAVDPPVGVGPVVSDFQTIELIDTDYRLTSAGFTYDNSMFILTGEASKYQIDLEEGGGIFMDEDGAYLTFWLVFR